MSYINELNIGNLQLKTNVLLAPMAGVTDLPFRNLCRSFGASLAFSEMVTSDKTLWKSEKSRSRFNIRDEHSPIAVQIFGTNPEKMATAAKHAISLGADIIDINMGCPAKKVCSKQAGVALMKNQTLSEEIMATVVAASDNIPVTLKIRTGWDKNSKNAQAIAKIAERSGISAITIHGRTKEDMYHGDIDYKTISEVKKTVSIPVIANGNIFTPEDAIKMLEETKTDGIMIGRGSQGKPWIFNTIINALTNKKKSSKIDELQILNIIIKHIRQNNNFYGDSHAARAIRKHLHWYCNNLSFGKKLWNSINKIDSSEKQIKIVELYSAEIT
ncbi:MAG: tRNA dihydrouridine synthase DusB [Gammaproteobacteria bacterium]|nr:MAG: tRNA dihydrouridine synthase DusB [Gammaproteobacteria bacterium]